MWKFDIHVFGFLCFLALVILLMVEGYLLSHPGTSVYRYGIPLKKLYVPRLNESHWNAFIASSSTFDGKVDSDRDEVYLREKKLGRYYYSPLTCQLNLQGPAILIIRLAPISAFLTLLWISIMTVAGFTVEGGKWFYIFHTMALGATVFWIFGYRNFLRKIHDSFKSEHLVIG